MPETPLAIDGKLTTLDLAEHKVPAYATGVVVFARVRCGWMATNPGNGEVSVKSGGIKRNLYFTTYKQDAWSFSSNYFTLPIGPVRSVTAEVSTKGRGNFKAAVQIIGYTTGCSK